MVNLGRPRDDFAVSLGKRTNLEKKSPKSTLALLGGRILSCSCTVCLPIDDAGIMRHGRAGQAADC